MSSHVVVCLDTTSSRSSTVNAVGSVDDIASTDGGSHATGRGKPGTPGLGRVTTQHLIRKARQMNNVIDITAKLPHWTDSVTCLACGHGWQAVAPEGTNVVECPRCMSIAGVRFSPRELLGDVQALMGVLRTLEKL